MTSRVRSGVLVSAILSVVTLAACEVTPRSEVCVPANDGKTITAIGYVSMGGFSLISSDNEFPIRLVESIKSEEHIRVNVKLGDGPNTMKSLPSKDFTNDDIELHLSDGSTKGWGDRISVTGTLAVTDDLCTLRAPVTLSPPP